MNQRLVGVKKYSYYEDMSAEMQFKEGKSILLSDFNELVESLINECKRVHGGHGLGIKNKDRKRLLKFADSFDMVVGNMFFKKVSKKLITFKFGGNSSVAVW